MGLLFRRSKKTLLLSFFRTFLGHVHNESANKYLKNVEIQHYPEKLASVTEQKVNFTNRSD